MTEIERLTKELSEIAAAIGTVRFMNPPDGGDVSLAEQIRRMRKALDAAEAWRDQFDCCMCGSPMKDHNIGSGHSPVSMYDYRLSKLEKDSMERLRLWIWELYEKHGDDLQAVWPTFDLVLNKIEEFRE